jgi:hypothetical protein
MDAAAIHWSGQSSFVVWDGEWHPTEQNEYVHMTEDGKAQLPADIPMPTNPAQFWEVLECFHLAETIRVEMIIAATANSRQAVLTEIKSEAAITTTTTTIAALTQEALPKETPISEEYNFGGGEGQSSKLIPYRRDGSDAEV